LTRKIIPYNPKLKQLARNNRNDSTKSEIKLWMELKGKQVYGYDFHRQKPLLNYIVDFYCNELELVIELDGYSHQFEEVVIKDELKEAELKNYGLTIFRFDDEEVMNDMDNVLRTIEQYIVEYEKSSVDE
jgi:very-short-patch-repair endonuclease